MVSPPRLFFYFSMTMTGVFVILTFWSLVSGKPVVDTTIAERVFQKDEISEPHAKFTLKKPTLLTMDVSSPTVSNSWLWVKTVIIDDNNNAVLERDFDLSYYYGSDWSEGSRKADWMFKLPAGDYKLLIYGENEYSSNPTRTRNDTLRVRVRAGTVLSRYFVLGFIVFLVLTFVANNRRKKAAVAERARRSQQELFS